MWRYGIGETPPKKRKHDNDAEKKEKDKQYEAKRVRSNIQSWLAGRSWLRYDKNSKKMFCDYCIKNGVATKYHVKTATTCPHAFVTVTVKARNWKISR